MALKRQSYEHVPHFENSRGERMFCKYWSPKLKNGKPPRGLVFISHGFAEHCEWYSVIAEPLAKEGLLVFAHDHAGHGRSEGEMAFITDYEHYVDDVLQHVNIVKKKYPRSPLHIIGHSMGGAISIGCVQREPDSFHGMVLLAPLIVPSPESATPWKVMAAKLLAWLWPRCPVAKINSDWISRDPGVVQSYKDDPLNYHGFIRAGWAVAGLNALPIMQARLHEICCPLLVIHGDDDKLCELSGSELLNVLAASKDKTLSVYKDAYHQVHFEPDGQGEECQQEVIKWLLERV